MECLVEVEEWWVAVPEAQSSVSNTAGPTKYLQVLLGTLLVTFSCFSNELINILQRCL